MLVLVTRIDIAEKPPSVFSAMLALVTRIGIAEKSHVWLVADGTLGSYPSVI